MSSNGGNQTCERDLNLTNSFITKHNQLKKLQTLIRNPAPALFIGHHSSFKKNSSKQSSWIVCKNSQRSLTKQEKRINDQWKKH